MAGLRVLAVLAVVVACAAGSRLSNLDSDNVFNILDAIQDLEKGAASLATADNLQTLEAETATYAASQRDSAQASVRTNLGELAAQLTQDGIDGIDRTRAAFIALLEEFNTRTNKRADDTIPRINTLESRVRSAVDPLVSAEGTLRAATLSTARWTVDAEISTRKFADADFSTIYASALGTVNNAVTSTSNALSTSISTLTSRANFIYASASNRAAPIAARPPLQKLFSSLFCPSHGYSSGGYLWAQYCYTGTEFDLLIAQGYIRLASATSIQILRAGVYRLNIWFIEYGNDYAYIRLFVNGVLRHQGHEYNGNVGAWTDDMMDVMWTFNAGDTFYIDSYGIYAFHAGNGSGYHSRFQIEYLGTAT